MTPREQVLLEILAEVTRPKTDHDTTRMEHPNERAAEPFFAGHGFTPDAAKIDLLEKEAKQWRAKYAELSISQDHWKALAEQSAKTIRELHEELSRARDEEREACAKVAEGGSFLHEDAPTAHFGREVAAAIRRRGSP